MSLISEIHNDLEKGALRLMVEYRARLFSDAVRLCGNPTDADDLVSRTFAKAIGKLDTYKEDDNLYGWLKTIMSNLHRNDMEHPVARGTVPVDDATLEQYAGADDSTMDQLMRNSDHDALREAINQLDPEYKKAVAMYYFNELSLKEIAAFLETSTSSVSRKLQIARRILAAKLGTQLGKKPVAIVVALLLSIATAFGAWKAADALGWLERAKDETAEVVEVQQPSEPAAATCETTEPAASESAHSAPDLETGKDEPSTKDLTTEKGESKMSIKTAVCACATGVALGVGAAEPSASIPASAYIQDGLVAQYDGIENAGVGMHDPNATTWVDLKGGHDIALLEGDSVGDDCVRIVKGTRTTETAIFDGYSQVTMEFNVRPTDMDVADNWSSPIVSIPYIGSFGWDARPGAIMVMRPQSETSASYNYRTYDSGYTKLADLIAAKKYKTYSAVPGFGNSSVGDSPVYVDGVKVSKVAGLNWDGGTRAQSLLMTVGSSKTVSDVRSIRIYNHELTPEEVAWNARIDAYRFCDQSDSYRWNADSQAIEGCMTIVAGAGGGVSVDGGAAMDRAECWFPLDGGPTRMTLTAVPADGYVFCRWTGDTEDLAFDQYRSPSISVVGGVRTLRAEFRVVGTNVHTVPGDFNSLAAALSSPLVKDGDTIQLADGTHAFAQEATVGDYTYLAAIDRFVTVRGSSPDKVVLDCGGAGGLYINHPAALVEGVTIQNFQRTSSTFALEFFNGVVSNVCISGSSGKCMYVKGSIPAIRAYEGALFEDCMITNINKQNWDTSSIASANGTIFRRTTFYGNKAYNGILSVAARSGVRTRLEDCAFAMNSDYYRPMISGSDVDVVDSVFYGNSNSDAGAGLNLSGVCTFDRCVVTNNTLNGSSPLVICNASSKVFATNCLFAANKIANWGAFKLGGKDVRLELVNCTVAANKTTSSTYCGGITGDGASGAKATVRLLNTVFWSNTANGVVKNFLDSYLYTDFDFDNSCFTGIVPTSGAGNTAVDPVFVDAAGGDFRLGENSSCIDTGADASAVVVDLDGTERPIDGTGGTNPKWDIGCYETIAREIPVQCSLKVLGGEGVWPCPMTQTVTVVGSRLTGLSYEWLAIRTEGHVPVTNRQVTAVAENVFEGLPVGVYSFVCTVSNDRGDTASSRIDDAFMMFAGTCYVSNDGSDTFPYTNAAMAARNLSTVIPLAGERIVIEPGEYKFGHYVDEQTGYDTMGAVYRAVAIEAGETAEDVILDCSGCGGLILANAGASLHGVTFRNYRTSVAAPVLYLKSGTVSNIVVSGDNVALKGGECVYVGELTELENLVVTNHRASAITVAGGTLRKALIFGCHSGSSSVVSTTQSSHGIGSTLEDVKISGCSTDSAAILALGSCNASRCTVVGNTNVNKNANCVSLGSSRLSDSRVVRNSAQCAVAVTTEWMDSYDVWMRNCLVAENKTSSRAAVAVPTTSRQYLLLENCTIIGNAAETAPAGGTLLASSSYVNHLKMVNCIIWGNTTGSEPADIAPGGDDFIYQNCCFREAEEEAYVTSKSCKDNLACDAGVKRNGKLMQLSPCRDAGQMLSWHVGGHDIDGNPRVCDVEKGGRVDIGCYENPLGRGFCILVR